MRELFDSGCFDECLRSLKQVAELGGAPGKAFTEEGVDRYPEDQITTDRIEINCSYATISRGDQFVAVSVRCTIIGIQPLRRGRVNARCTAPRRLL